MNVFQKDPFLVLGSTSKVKEEKVENQKIIKLMKMSPPSPLPWRSPGDNTPMVEVSYEQYRVDEIWQDLTSPDQAGRKKVAKRIGIFHYNIMFLDPRENKPKLIRDLYLDCVNQIKGADEWPVRIYVVGLQINEEG